MKIKTAELTGPALDWAVEEAGDRDHMYRPRSYSTEWAQGGPIIEREGIELIPDGNGQWGAAIRGGDEDDTAQGSTPLIAAMRCFVQSRLGDEVDIPEELL